MQYVAQVAGYGSRHYYCSNESRLLVYKLGGNAPMPAPAPLPPRRVLAPPEQFGSAEVIDNGKSLFSQNCAMCHDTQYGNRGLFPDLRYSPMINTAEAFKAVVIDGILTSKGMVSFRDKISEQDVDAIRAYMTQRAHQALAAQRAAPPAAR